MLLSQYLPLLRRHNSALPVVLVGCQADQKTAGAGHKTLLEADTVMDTESVVMHVETAPQINIKSVIVAFQVYQRQQ